MRKPRIAWSAHSQKWYPTWGYYAWWPRWTVVVEWVRLIDHFNVANGRPI